MILAIYVASVSGKRENNKAVLHIEVHDGQRVIHQMTDIIDFRRRSESVFRAISDILDKGIDSKNTDVIISFCDDNTYRACFSSSMPSKESIRLRGLCGRYSSVRVKRGGLLSRYMMDKTKLLAEKGGETTGGRH